MKYIKALFVAASFILATAAFLLPIPSNSELAKSFTNTAHVCLFFFLTILVISFWKETSWKIYVLVGIFLTVFGLSLEFIQPLFNRSISAYDALNNIYGITAGILFCIALRSRNAVNSKTKYLASSGAIIIILSSLLIPLRQLLSISTLAPLPVLADFEGLFPSYRIKTYGNSVAHVVPNNFGFTNNSSRALQTGFGPSNYSGFSIVEPHKNWQQYSEFSFEVFSPESRVIPLKLKINDKLHDQTYEDRFNITTPINPGSNRVSIPLALIEKMGKKQETARKMDLTQINSVQLFLSKPTKAVNLYFDNFTLK